MAVHNLKTWPQYFAAIISGEKTFEIRKNDREFKVGDSLFLQEFLPSYEQFTGRVWVVIVTYIFKGGTFGVNSSYCVLGIRQLSTAELGIKLNVTQQMLPGSEDSTQTCPDCKGSGNDPEWRHGSVDDCPRCKGSGKLQVT